ncbi:MAG: DMP19 family protein [Chloroflexi bacterium]|nr:DMP19 family protein [Chloroflexota bacterium]
MNKPFLETYGGQTIQQLIAMKESHRVDSLVLAVEQALRGKPEMELSEPERVVLAVEAMEREVNNGGYNQFFGNSSGKFTGFLVRALELIGCPKVATISADAIAVLKLPEPFDADTVGLVAYELSDESIEQLDKCDSRYYANDESIEQRLFAYIEEYQNEIQIPHVA